MGLKNPAVRPASAFWHSVGAMRIRVESAKAYEQKTEDTAPSQTFHVVVKSALSHFPQEVACAVDPRIASGMSMDRVLVSRRSFEFH